MEVTCLFLHFNNSTSDNPIGHRATDEEVGQAIAYEAGLSFATLPPEGGPLAAPAWVQGLFGYLNNRFDTIDNSIRGVQGEFTILLANSHAALDAPLYDPTRPGEWVFLAAPNPTSRDNLMTFDCE